MEKYYLQKSFFKKCKLALKFLQFLKTWLQPWRRRVHKGKEVSKDTCKHPCGIFDLWSYAFIGYLSLSISLMESFLDSTCLYFIFPSQALHMSSAFNIRSHATFHSLHFSQWWTIIATHNSEKSNLSLLPSWSHTSVIGTAFKTNQPQPSHQPSVVWLYTHGGINNLIKLNIASN